MPHEENEAAASRIELPRGNAPRNNALRFAAIAAAMALLAGCAVRMPMREIAPAAYVLTDIPGSDLNCSAGTFDPECLDAGADDGAAYRHAPTAGGGKINPHDDTDTNVVLNRCSRPYRC
jgi:hypothetical protein